MARYYLHQYSPQGGFADDEGQDCATLEAARLSAIAGIRSIMADDILHGFLRLDLRIDICDEAGARVATVPFSDAFQLHS